MDAKIFKKLEEIENRLASFPTKKELKQSLNSLKRELIQKIDDSEIAIIARVDKFIADKDELYGLVWQIKSLEQKIAD